MGDLYGGSMKYVEASEKTVFGFDGALALFALGGLGAWRESADTRPANRSGQ